MIILRTLHILGAIIWAGSTFLFAGFSQVFFESDQADDMAKLKRMIEYGRLSDFSGIGAFLAGIPGLFMYWRLSGHFSFDFLSSGRGLTLTIAGVVGLAAGLIGGSVLGLTNQRVEKLHEEIEAQDEPLNADQAALIRKYRARLIRTERWSSLLLLIATLGMIISRYVAF
jgi:hypothetical protein